MRAWRFLAARLPALLAVPALLAGLAAPAHADTPIALWKSFDGRVNFTGTQVTLRTKGNFVSGNNGNGNGGKNTGDPCAVSAASTIRQASLTLPTGATVLSAQLYWAGSGTPDSTITFQGAEVTASRKFTSSTIGSGFDYFGAAADVTEAVKAKGSGTYNFSGLTVSTGSPWCGAQGVLGGFSLLVVYALAAEPERVLNIYEGFQYVQNGEVVVNASNFRWNRTALAVKEKARVGHISWEGDPTLAANGERLSFEGEEVTDTLNPAGNQFNSVSNINNDSASHGIDFDAYDTSVTLWSGYDAVVTTSYQTGQDMVLLNAEVLVVPTLPVADLSIAIARTGALKIGTDAEYKVTVTNNGPYTEAGPITVTNTLPAGMHYVSGVATGWSCSASATAGTCTYSGALAPGASAPVLTVKARVTTVGEKTNTVKVSGRTTDDNLVNNEASDTGTATAADGTTTPPSTTPPVYIFTDSVCVSDIALGAAGQTCRKYGAATVGGKPAPVFLTVTANGVPRAASTTKDTVASMQFMLECINPDAGSVGASFGGTPLPVCAAQGQLASWSAAVDVTFPAKAVSVERSLVYNDIGKIRLNMKVKDEVDMTAVFVSKPSKVGFKRIAYGGHDNPQATTGAGLGFAPAGAPLKIEIGALLHDGVSYAPAFGNESPRPAIVLAGAEIPGKGTGVLTETAAKRSWGNGVLTAEAAWSEVGAVNFVVRADDPDMPSDAQNRYFGEQVGAGTAPVGRFYPAYFTTEVTRPYNCPHNLPAKDYPCTLNEMGVAYSRQPFKVAVHAYGAGNARLKNFGGEWFRPVTLHAAASNGAGLLPLDFTPAPGESTTKIAGATAEAGAQLMRGTATYTLARGYDNAAPRATNLTPPTMVHVRAVASEDTVAGKVEVTSRRTGEVSDEGGILVLNGRMKLPNAIGSDLLPTPLRLRAEYWAGAAGWLMHWDYLDKRLVADTQVSFKNCTQGFLLKDGSGKCDPAAAGVPPSQEVQFTRRGGVLWLRAPGKLGGGATRGGRFDVDHKDTLVPWLPGTTGRVSFGSHRSPVIYVREMYF